MFRPERVAIERYRYRGTKIATPVGLRDDRITRTSGMNMWRAGCSGSCTSGSEGGPENPTHRKVDRALRSDPYSEHWTDEGKLYCCAIKDVFSNRIVGWAIDSRMKARLVIAAVEMAVARRGDVAGCISHSDRGSQFRARKVHRALARHGMVGSMGQVGSAGDNAAIESFFALLERNVLDRRPRWATRTELRIAIVTWIERTYHRRRRQAALGRLTPVEYETIMTPQTATAA
jgi:transposase InsO family protein